MSENQVVNDSKTENKAVPDDTPIDKRIYIGGLHQATTEEQIRERFSKFGTLKNIEVAKNVEGECRGFAHMTIHTTPKQWDTCLSVYKGAKWRGLSLKLEEAQMDWQQKRNLEAQKEIEREEKKRKRLARWNDSEGFHAKDMSLITDNNMGTRKNWKRGRYGRAIAVMRLRKHDGTKFVFEPSHYKNNLTKLYNIGVRMKPVSKLITKIDDEYTDDEEDYTSFQNQNNVNDEFEEGDEDYENSEPTKMTDDEKRRAAMEKMFEEQRQRKELLNKSLAEAKANQLNHTKFEDFEAENENDDSNDLLDTVMQEAEDEKPIEGTKWMFDSDEESEGEFNIEINPVLEGEQGRKRLELQKKFKGDDRFKLGEDFIDEDENKKVVDNTDDITKELNAEKGQAMDLLRAMFGDEKVDSKPKAQSNHWSTTARFDPDAEDATKYLSEKASQALAANEESEEDDDEDFFAQPRKAESAMPSVSLEKHFEVNANLKPLFGGGEGAFTLFGGNDNEPAQKSTPLFGGSSNVQQEFSSRFTTKKQEGRLGLGVMFFFHFNEPSLIKKSCYAYDAEGVFQEKPEERESYEAKWREQRPIIKEVLKKRQKNATRNQKKRAI